MMSEGNVNVRQENYEKKIMWNVITAVTVNKAMRNGVLGGGRERPQIGSTVISLWLG